MTPAITLGSSFERRRLAHRAARVQRVLRAMRQLADDRPGPAPRPLRHGIADFEHELEGIERRLRELRDDDARAHR